MLLKCDGVFVLLDMADCQGWFYDDPLLWHFALSDKMSGQQKQSFDNILCYNSRFSKVL